MENAFLIITSVANADLPVLQRFAAESSANNIPFILIGDIKSPQEFNLDGCDFYSIDRQKSLSFELGKVLPFRHYARKNLGYLLAISKGAEIIIETDDDNIPLPGFWNNRIKKVNAHLLRNKGWVNIYKYFTDVHIWPRGFALENLLEVIPDPECQIVVDCPIQQGLADENPDVDAIYRLAFPLPFKFNKGNSIALGDNSFCPFNSQNTTWFRESFPLMYLPSYCSFRMTDIWRSFIAQRIAWECGWSILFHQSTVHQERNVHNLINDFREEIPGYLNNGLIYNYLKQLSLIKGIENIPGNLVKCYQRLIEIGLIGQQEMNLILAWLEDIKPFIQP